VSGKNLDKKEIAGLRELRKAGERGLTLYAGGTIFCSGLMTVKTWRVLAANAFSDVVAGRILITPAGAEFLDGVP
jgi:hypothetical protein